MIIKVNQSLIERFWNKVEGMSSKTGNDCWNWIAAKDENGYGLIKIQIGYLVYKVIRSHILSYLMFKGNIPDGMHICHSCDNPPCINPWHLDCKTRSGNMKDMVSRGRQNHRNTNKTHCIHGHEFTLENTRINIKGYRYCKICDKNRNDGRNYSKLIKPEDYANYI